MIAVKKKRKTANRRLRRIMAKLVLLAFMAAAALSPFHLGNAFLRSADFDSSSPEVLAGWMDIVRTLRPREVMVYTIDRETPQEGLVKFTAEEMRELVRPLSEEGFMIQIRG